MPQLVWVFNIFIHLPRLLIIYSPFAQRQNFYHAYRFPDVNVKTSFTFISIDGLAMRREFTRTAPLVIILVERLLVLKNLAHQSHLSIRTFFCLSSKRLIFLFKTHQRLSERIVWVDLFFLPLIIFIYAPRTFGTNGR